MNARRPVAVGLICLFLLPYSNARSESAFSETRKRLTDRLSYGQAVAAEITVLLESDAPAVQGGSISAALSKDSYSANWIGLDGSNASDSVSIWETKDDVWLTFGSDETGGDALCVPIENTRAWDGIPWDALSPDWNPLDALANKRMRAASGIGGLLANPIVRFWSETDDRVPIWDMLTRQWVRLQARMTSYVDDGASAPGMSGIDRPSHCTTYKLTGEQFADVLSQWALGLSIDPQVLWLSDALAMDGEEQAAYTAWFGALSEQLAGMTSTGKLTLRVYLDGFDEVCGVNGSVTMKTVSGERVPVSVTYRKKTSGSKITRTLRLSAMPEGKSDGFDLRAEFVSTNNPKGNNRRTASVRLNGRRNGVTSRTDLSWSYSNDWIDSETGREESINGKGELAIRLNGKDSLSLDWIHTASGSASATPALEEHIEFTLSSDGRIALVPVDECSGSVDIRTAASELPPPLPDASALNLINFKEDALQENERQLGAGTLSTRP
ncbi:MAG: hypothetical protein LBS72_05875 [Oscillospiraceae bacterium]|jgi:hypothetical protein|nr:hypothetical protein [Oscillospiraceae bacterium]